MSNGANWAKNYSYGAADFVRPSRIEEVQEIVASSNKVHALGSRHSFNSLPDTSGTLISLDRIDDDFVIDEAAQTVRVSGGVRYGELARFLSAKGYALANLASLPHISIAGATATATHGSGNGNQNLSAAIESIELITATGDIRVFNRGDAGFDGAAVSIGALGIAARLTLRIEPNFDVAVSVYEGLAWATLQVDFEAIMGSAYSVSCFVDYSADHVEQLWTKRRVDDPRTPGATSPFAGGVSATVRRHPLPGVDAEACTEQLGIAGNWSDRLSHFRLDFTPSNGEEIQSEYLLPRVHASAAIEALRGLGDQIAPLLQVSEIRTIAKDSLWLSSAYEADIVGFHFTWKKLQREVEALLPDIEAALAPFAARPHWGKVFTLDAAAIAPLYPRFDDFIALATQLDPEQKFRNDFLARHVFA